MVEWNTGMTLIVLAISVLGVCNGSESSKFILAVCQSVEQIELVLVVTFSSHCLGILDSRLKLATAL